MKPQDLPTREQVESLRTELEGKRIRYAGSAGPDPYAPLEVGDTGLVTMVDAMGTIHVDWDSGRRLGLVYRVDYWVFE
jgi:hypothetical protein